ncbi:MAG TPA: SpoIIE family protein phosphatase [Gemmataceae bacterium]|nr:SpoIIE family protein phosphatase [Gemmataceae bacterium]
MTRLITLQGPSSGQQFPLAEGTTIIGRQPDSAIYLESLAVSRQHAQVTLRQGVCTIEDLGSSNGTYLNGKLIPPRTPQPLTEQDMLQIGPYVLALRRDTEPPPSGPHPHIRAEVSVLLSNQTLYTQNPAHKLQVVLEISQHLARTLEEGPLLDKLLDQLLVLFPQADRAMVIRCEGDRLVPRAQRSRGPEVGEFRFSRTIVNKALEEGVGILSEDVRDGRSVEMTPTLLALNVRSFLCVPMISPDGRRLGAIQMDCSRPAMMFGRDDLELLTAIGLQAAVALDNAALHAERLQRARLEEEVRLAREIQQGFLPTDFAPLGEAGFELFACVYPAREVSGDLYDFFVLDDGRLAFFVGDVSGKGVPASLFMVAVRTLTRHLAPSVGSPGETLRRLNTALAADNPAGTFVTLAHGVYDPRTSEVVLASGGHPRPLLRRADGQVEAVEVPAGRLLGCDWGPTMTWREARLTLAPGETLILYTDGFTEARAPDGQTMFGERRLSEVLGGPRTALNLPACAEEARVAVERFTGTREQQDDLTLLLLRRQ